MSRITQHDYQAIKEQFRLISVALVEAGKKFEALRERAEQAERDRDVLQKFLESTVCGLETGRIVSSADLTEHQLVEAQAKNRWFVAPTGLAWAMVPWTLTTPNDRAREHGWDNIDKALPMRYTSDDCKPASGGDTLDDGHGNQWRKCGPNCTLDVVRPGEVQCEGECKEVKP